jgi:hypothetical protein
MEPSEAGPSPPVMPDMFASAFRYAERSGIVHMTHCDKLNASRKVQRRVALVTHDALISCDEDGSIRRVVPLAVLSGVSLMTLAVDDGSVQRTGIVFEIASHYDLLILPIGDSGLETPSSPPPPLLDAVLKCHAATQQGKSTVAVQRLGAYAQPSMPTLRFTEVMERFHLRKPEGTPLPLVVRLESPLLVQSPAAIAAAAEMATTASRGVSPSESVTTVVDVIDESPTRRALATTSWRRNVSTPALLFTPEPAEVVEPLHRVPASSPPSSPRVVIDTVQCLSPERRRTIAVAQSAWDSTGLKAAEEVEALRGRVRELEAEVEFWRRRFLTVAPTADDAGFGGHEPLTNGHHVSV